MRDRFLEILDDSAPPDSMTWLRTVLDEQTESFQQRAFYYAFSGVSRRFDKAAAVSEKNDAAPGWDHFRIARVILLLLLAEQEESTFLATYRALLDTADLREQIALYSALPWLPCPEELLESTIDGLRTNIVDVFDSIALDNSYPAEHFPEEAWNQMVLKAIFITRPLHRIVGTEKRRNAALAEAISDLAHERWAAGRWINPEAWQSVIGFFDDRLVGDMTKVADSGEPEDRDAAALVVSEDSSGDLSRLHPGLEAELSRVKSGKLTWLSLGHAVEAKLERKSLT
ncbi:MAG: EboA domain-containing protein [Verrucomicrobiota bacterium]